MVHTKKTIGQDFTTNIEVFWHFIFIFLTQFIESCCIELTITCWMQVVGTLSIPIKVFCFEIVCAKCHLPFLTNREAKHCYYVCKCMVETHKEPRIFCKIKQENGENFDNTLCEPWIKVLLKHNLEIQINIIAKQGFFIHLFKEKKPIGKISPTAKLVRYTF